MLKNNVYKLIVLPIIHSVFTLSLHNKIEKTNKLRFMYCLGQKLFLLLDFGPYDFKNSKSDNVLVISKTKRENLFIIPFL